MTRNDLKGIFFLFFFSLIIAFSYNHFSVSGIALSGQWELSKGVVSARPTADDVNDAIQINDPEIKKVAGFSLIFGPFSRSALLIINTLLLGFIFLIGFNLLRGHEFDCGCFEFSSQNNIVSNVFVLIRNVLFLLSGIYLFRKMNVQ